jgi:tight adherence protein B
LLGFDMIGAFASVPGAVCLVGGGILIAVAVRWNRRLLRWASDLDATPGLAYELMAIALSGGGSIDRATDVVTTACAATGLESPGEGVRAVLDFAADAGAPLVSLLRAEADERRRVARAEAAGRSARLETRLLLPLGLCVLPAFVLLGVAPIALAILSSTAGVL